MRPPPLRAEILPDDENTMPAITAAHVGLITAAFACDLTRIVTLQFSSAINEIRYPWLQSLGSGHMLSHSTDASSQAEIVLRETWTASQIAELMNQLAAVPEGDGTMLDHTLIVWANELGWGSTHTHDDIPFLLAGGAPGIRFGRYLQLPATGQRCALDVSIECNGRRGKRVRQSAIFVGSVEPGLKLSSASASRTRGATKSSHSIQPKPTRVHDATALGTTA